MNIDQVRATLGTICSFAALALAIAAGLKLGGFISARASVIELAAVAIALAHVR